MNAKRLYFNSDNPTICYWTDSVKNPRGSRVGALDPDSILKCRRKFRNWLDAPIRSPLLSCTESNPASVSPKRRRRWNRFSKKFILVINDHKSSRRRHAGAGHCFGEKVFPGRRQQSVSGIGVSLLSKNCDCPSWNGS